MANRASGTSHHSGFIAGDDRSMAYMPARSATFSPWMSFDRSRQLVADLVFGVPSGDYHSAWIPLENGHWRGAILKPPVCPREPEHRFPVTEWLKELQHLADPRLRLAILEL